MPSSLPLTELRSLVLDIAPELRERPLYVMQQQPSFPADDALGYACVRGNEVIADYLKATGEWEGNGPAIVFCADNLSRDCQLSLGFHETAHILPAMPEVIDQPLLTVPEFAALCGPAPAIEPHRPRWSVGDHGKSFIRTCIHLWWRAAFRGFIADLPMLAAGPVYDLSSMGFYWKALDNEPHKMQDATFAEILATKAPEQFDAVWYADLKYWIDRHPNTEAA